MNKELGQIFTSKTVANYMVSLFNISLDKKVLEPCFGKGVFLESLLRRGFKNIYGCEIDSQLFNEVCKKYNKLNLYNSDFLNFNSNEKFDGIIMNPPYIRHEKINSLSKYGITKEKLQHNKIFDNLEKTANLYMYFVIKAIHLLKEKGELIVIFPSSWLKTHSGKVFKENLLLSCSIVHKIHIHGQIFDENALVDVIILHLVKQCSVIQCIEQNLYLKNNKIVMNNIEKFSLHKLETNFNDIAVIKRGLTTGFNEMFINPGVPDVQKIISSPRNILGYSTDNAKTDTILLLKKGITPTKETFKYVKKWEDKIIKDKAPKTIYDKIINKQEWFNLKYSFDAKIIFNYFIRNNMKFVYNASHYIIKDNFYVIKPKIDDKLCFGLLNNYYTFLQLELLGKKYGNGLLKLQTYDFYELRFPDIKKMQSKDINDIIRLASNLIENGDVNCIDELSKIIIKYTYDDYEKIKNLYLNIVKNRLEEKNEK